MSWYLTGNRVGTRLYDMKFMLSQSSIRWTRIGGGQDSRCCAIGLRNCIKREKKASEPKKNGTMIEQMEIQGWWFNDRSSLVAGATRMTLAIEDIYIFYSLHNIANNKQWWQARSLRRLLQFKPFINLLARFSRTSVQGHSIFVCHLCLVIIFTNGHDE